MSILYFTMLLFELLPFCYMSFYVFDRKFYMADRATDLYYTSAYYVAHTVASKPCLPLLPCTKPARTFAPKILRGWCLHSGPCKEGLCALDIAYPSN